MSLQFTVFPFDDVGAITHTAKLSVPNTQVELTLTAGKRGISIQNVGSKIAWWGGTGLVPADKDGNQLFPNQTMLFRNVRHDFSIFFRCGGTDSTELGIVEYS